MKSERTERSWSGLNVDARQERGRGQPSVGDRYRATERNHQAIPQQIADYRISSMVAA